MINSEIILNQDIFNKDHTYVLTAGTKYVDIDVLACAVALLETLTLCNIKASIYLPGPFNGTIPKKYTNYKDQFLSKCPQDVRYVLLDMSSPSYMDPLIPIDHVDVVFDHHYGYELFWKKRLMNRSIIEPVGACGTLIAEQALNVLGKDTSQ